MGFPYIHIWVHYKVILYGYLGGSSPKPPLHIHHYIYVSSKVIELRCCVIMDSVMLC